MIVLLKMNQERAGYLWKTVILLSSVRSMELNQAGENTETLQDLRLRNRKKTKPLPLINCL